MVWWSTVQQYLQTISSLQYQTKWEAYIATYSYHLSKETCEFGRKNFQILKTQKDTPKKKEHIQTNKTKYKEEIGGRELHYKSPNKLGSIKSRQWRHDYLKIHYHLCL